MSDLATKVTKIKTVIGSVRNTRSEKKVGIRICLDLDPFVGSESGSVWKRWIWILTEPGVICLESGVRTESVNRVVFWIRLKRNLDLFFFGSLG